VMRCCAVYRSQLVLGYMEQLRATKKQVVRLRTDRVEDIIQLAGTLSFLALDAGGPDARAGDGRVGPDGGPILHTLKP
jgi:hypothetical protein